jgi:hypothetical protein
MEQVRVIYSGTPDSPGIGFAGLWKGFAPRVVMIGTLTGLQWYASRPRCIEIISLSFFFF